MKIKIQIELFDTKDDTIRFWHSEAWLTEPARKMLCASRNHNSPRDALHAIQSELRRNITAQNDPL